MRVGETEEELRQRCFAEKVCDALHCICAHNRDVLLATPQLSRRAPCLARNRTCTCLLRRADAAARREPKRINNLKLLLVFSTESFDALVDVGSHLFSDLDAYRYLVGKPFSLHDASTQQTRRRVNNMASALQLSDYGVLLTSCTRRPPNPQPMSAKSTGLVICLSPSSRQCAGYSTLQSTHLLISATREPRDVQRADSARFWVCPF